MQKRKHGLHVGMLQIKISRFSTYNISNLYHILFKKSVIIKINNFSQNYDFKQAKTCRSEEIYVVLHSHFVSLWKDEVSRRPAEEPHS